MGPMGLIGPMGPMRLMGPMGPMGPMRLMRLMGLIALIGLMGLLGSCSKEQVEEPTPVDPGKAITFGAVLQPTTQVEAGTRSETPLEDLNITDFMLWAFKNKDIEDGTDPINYTTPQCVIPSYTVSWTENTEHTTTTNSDGWEYVDGADQTIKYWDWDATAYKFFGYAPATASATVEFYKPNGASGAYEAYEANEANWANVDWGNYTKCRVSIDADASTAASQTATPYISRLWFSNGNTTENYQPFGKAVQLQFVKPFAQVRFMYKFVNEGNAGLTRDVIDNSVFAPTDPQAGGIAISGKVRLEVPLTGTATKETWSTAPTSYMTDKRGDNIYFTQDWYELTDAELATAQANNEDAKIANQRYWYTVLPANDQGSYTLTAVVNGDDRTADVPAAYMNWLPGYSYTYIFKVSAGGDISFNEVQVAIKKWTITSTEEKEVYNW